MIEAQRENLNVNKLIAEKKEIIFVEGDMIVPDSKPDILNTICTSGVVCIYKKDVLDEIQNVYLADKTPLQVMELVAQWQQELKDKD